MMTRIADDDVAVSSVLCRHCVARMGSAVYPPPLKHSSEEDGTLITAVDVALELNGVCYKITRLNRNDAFCVTGTMRQARTRFLPPLRPPLVTLSPRVGWLAGSLALDHQRNPSPSHCKLQGMLAVLELVRLGHSFSQLEVALRAIQRVKLKATARFLALLPRQLRRIPISSRTLYSHFFQYMQPLITSHGAIAGVPMHVNTG